jgi:quercetin dioxygenase-like cupin family protein
MSQHIHHLPFSVLPPVTRGLGIVNYPIATKKQGAKSIHSGLTRLPVGAVVPPHSHNTEEQVTVLEGRVRFVLGDQTHDCDAYDSTFISGGVVHEFSNIGDKPALVIVIYGSANVNRTFARTGQTVEIGSEGDKFPEVGAPTA